MISSLSPRPRALVAGFGITGRAITRYLREHGHDVVVVDDRPTPELVEAVEAMGVRLVAAPDADRLRALVESVDVVSPTPGLPPQHPVFAFAAEAGVEVVGEIEIGARAALAPIVAVTGTNGKTTVTTLVTHLVEVGGRRALAAGNIGTPLVEVVEGDVDVLVVEVSSFQLALTHRFHPKVAVWLNLAEDHRDAHPTMEDYAAAKARIWANQTDDDVAVVNADDPVVMAHAATAPSRLVTFGIAGDWRVLHGRIVGRDHDGTALDVIAVAELPRSLPHDVDNALAAAAAAHAMGVDVDALRRGLRTAPSLPHRVSLVGEAGGVRWFDDSKATTPVSVLAALRGFDSVVLIAGGRNKGLDLGVLGAAAGKVRTVVAIGDAAPEVRAAFEGRVPVVDAPSMDDAVRAAAGAARDGDAVLLSPGCASYDWYRSYGERGDDFARAVRELVLGTAG